MATRRDTLKIIGAVGTTCAFPFGADELYGQHVEGARAASFFTETEMLTLAKLADLIIPPTDTPGGSQAGVPAYIDMVVYANKEHRELFRAGLTWLDKQRAKPFRELTEAAQIAILTPLCEAADESDDAVPGAKFFRALKNMTADGYYTSKAGLVDELGYKGNMAMAGFPSCEIKEH
jgi:hypothetical protein